MTDNEKLPDFGDYVHIEQKRHGIDNEMYLYKYKVIGRIKSNYYVDVPVQSPAENTCHVKVVPVVRCICCGVSEDKVLRFRLEDVTIKIKESYEANRPS